MATSIATAVEQQSVTANEVSSSEEKMAMVSRETEDASTSLDAAGGAGANPAGCRAE